MSGVWLCTLTSPGRRIPPPRVDRLVSPERACNLVARTDRRDAIRHDRDRPVGDDRPRIIEGEDERVLHHEVAGDRPGRVVRSRPCACRHRSHPLLPLGGPHPRAGHASPAPPHWPDRAASPPA